MSVLEESETPGAFAHDHLTLFKMRLITAIAQSPAKGLDVRDRVEAVTGKDIHHGRLYPNLDDLARNGYIEKDRNAIDNRSNRYSVTEKGRNRIEAEARWILGSLDGDSR